MNGAHDVGGAHGFGPVVPDKDTLAFHADWERTTFALAILMGSTGSWSIDRSRYMRESLPHATYYNLSYYGIWLAALERLIDDMGLKDSEEPPKKILNASDVRSTMARGFPAERPGPAPRFQPGDKVRVKMMNPTGHTRAPRYVRGRLGTVVRIHGVHVLPDTSAHNAGENPSPLYNVAFDAIELWGPDTTASAVHVDLFEPYLDAV